jgi:hypothetical protein
MWTNAPPADRGLVRKEGEALWGFPKDYPAWAREAERTEAP